jgi:hypothetical protein
MLRAIAAAKKKNDRIDADKIADCLRCDFLPECHMASTAIRDRQRTLRCRHLLVRHSFTLISASLQETLNLEEGMLKFVPPTTESSARNTRKLDQARR